MAKDQITIVKEKDIDIDILFIGGSKLLRPCCQGVTKEYLCGNVEKDTGIMKYNVCGNVSDSFFWDMIHPSQQGWHTVSSNLRSSLLQLL